jgi:hypothetical protein
VDVTTGKIANQASACIISHEIEHRGFSVSFINAQLMSRITQRSLGTVSHGQINVANDRLAVAAFVG